MVPLLWQEDALQTVTNRSELGEKTVQVQWDWRRYRGQSVWRSYNWLIGGVRISQERSSLSFDCEALKENQDVFDMPRVGGHRYELSSEAPLPDFSMKWNRKRITWLFIGESAASVQQRILEMELQPWLDCQTMKAELTFPIYNAEFGIHAVIYVSFFMSRGGMIRKAVMPLSTFADSISSSYFIIWGAVWGICFLWIVFLEMQHIGSKVWHLGCLRGLAQYANLRHFLNMATLFANASIILMFYFLVRDTARLNETLKSLGRASEASDSAKYESVFHKEYLPSLEGTVQYADTVRLAMAVYPLVILIRVLWALAAQPGLGVLARSMAFAMEDASHTLLVLFAVIVFYAASGVVLFGRRLESFVTVNRSVGSIFRMFLGEIDWDRMKQVGQLEASIFLVSFSCIARLLIVNILISIVLAAHGDQKKRSDKTESLHKTASNVFSHYFARLRGTDLPLKHILHLFRNTLKGSHHKAAQTSLADPRVVVVDDEVFHPKELEILTVDRFRRAVEGLGEEQAKHLLVGACRTFCSTSDWQASHEDVQESAITLLQDVLSLEKVVASCDFTLSSTADVAGDLHVVVDAYWKKLPEAVQGGCASQKVHQAMRPERVPGEGAPSISFDELLRSFDAAAADNQGSLDVRSGRLMGLLAEMAAAADRAVPKAVSHRWSAAAEETKEGNDEIVEATPASAERIEAEPATVHLQKAIVTVCPSAEERGGSLTTLSAANSQRAVSSSWRADGSTYRVLRLQSELEQVRAEVAKQLVCVSEFRQRTSHVRRQRERMEVAIELLGEREAALQDENQHLRELLLPLHSGRRGDLWRGSSATEAASTTSAAVLRTLLSEQQLLRSQVAAQKASLPR
eukprot:TRINITY_DN23162_c0_g1_i1.p1 TRINITY_DN23162_c0_g1~~TRINITY_DN23162_c0_g1_i1.p1  ORF type:complete len:1007 (+),score=151.49 TRINITY_DN23162_c0_g1_i1:445-3021(+)